MGAPYIVLSFCPFLCQNLLHLVKIGQRYDTKKTGCFFEIRCICMYVCILIFNVAAHNDDDERRQQMSVTIYSKQKCSEAHLN